MKPWILGISAFYHDSAAALLHGGEIIAAAQEERFTRKKNDECFPIRAIEYCLAEGRLTPADLTAVAFYDKPITKFTRTLEAFLAVAPKGWRLFPTVVSGWLSEKLNMRQTIRDEIPGLARECELLFAEHHQSHAASAFYPSPFSEAAILTIDGVGEWATTTIGRGYGDKIELLKELRFPHSLGLLYSAFTAYCGFRVNSGEYKLMGLAPYGTPRYAERIRDNLIDLKEDGSFRLNLEYFSFLHSDRMTNRRFDELFEGPPREIDTEITQRHMDLARSIQEVTEEVVLRLARQAVTATGHRRLCMAGGVALNCVANGRILRERVVDDLWIQPAAGDAGGALGAALAAWRQRYKCPPPSPAHQPEPVTPRPSEDWMKGALLGPAYSDEAIQEVLALHSAVAECIETEELVSRVALLLAEGKIVGWFQGRMEFGPRALGSRSILADPRSPAVQSQLNLKTKFRESFRPFAPAVLAEKATDWFDLPVLSPYMLLVAAVAAKHRRPAEKNLSGLDLLNAGRSAIPAVTHVDYSARVQTVGENSNPLFRRLIEAFEKLTGCPILVNTSFNVRGEPMVCSPDDAYRCFVNTHMDYLAIGSFLLDRGKQPGATPPSNFHPIPD